MIRRALEGSVTGPVVGADVTPDKALVMMQGVLMGRILQARIVQIESPEAADQAAKMFARIAAEMRRLKKLEQEVQSDEA